MVAKRGLRSVTCQHSDPSEMGSTISSSTSPSRPRIAYLAMSLVVFVSLFPSEAFQPSIVGVHNNNPSRNVRTISTLHPRQTSRRRRRDEQRQWASSLATPDAAGTRQAMSDWAKRLAHGDSSEANERQHRKSEKMPLGQDVPSPFQEDYRRRTDEWANRYTKVDSLREMFGSNRNRLWGDLDPTSARRLYKSLLPKALLELVKVSDVHPEDLAPLAYQARVAAKLYARERCQMPARVAANLFDGFRQWRRYGKFQTSGMSYDQVWDKYHKRILTEALGEDADLDIDDYSTLGNLNEEDVKAQICLKILEGSCSTNEQIDRWVLPSNEEGKPDTLASVEGKVEDDIRKLLLPLAAAATTTTPENLLKRNHRGDCQSGDGKSNLLTAQQYRALRLVARARRRAKSYRQASSRQDDDKDDTLLASASASTPTMVRPWNDRESKVRNRTKLWLRRDLTSRSELSC